MESPEKAMNSDKVTSTASDNRKNSKPVMEKRRRARINASLAELKSLLLDVMKSEGTRQNKMEKADILEMTVRHLRQLQRQQFSALSATDPAVINKYRLGFSECANEVSKYLGNIDDIDAEIRARLLNHLANCSMNQDSNEQKKEYGCSVSPSKPPYQPSFTNVTSSNLNPVQATSNQVLQMKSNPIIQISNSTSETFTSVPLKFADKNGNVINTKGNEPCFEGKPQPKLINGVQAIPTQMSSGEMALIIPAANMVQYGTIPNYVIPVIQPQNAIQLNNSSGHVIQTHSPLQIAYSGNTVAAHGGVVASVFPNTAIVNTVSNVSGMPVALHQTNTCTLNVNPRENQQEKQYSTVLSLNGNMPPCQDKNTTLSDKESISRNAPATSSGFQLGIPNRVSNEQVNNERVDPMWRPW